VGPSGAPDRRLSSWKEIAAHLDRTVRTAQRWERTEGLPVRRHGHSQRASVYADASELDGWWAARRARLEREEREERQTSSRRRGRLLVGAGMAALLAALAVWATNAGLLRRPAPALPFAQRDWVLVTDFDNQTGEPMPDKALLTAFTVGVEQSRYANVLPRTRVAEALRRMEKADDSRIDEPLGREVALREHVKAVISCTVSRTGHEYALSVRLVEPQTGAAVQSYLEVASSQDRLIGALGKVAARVRRDLGESLASIRQTDEPLPEVTTPSLQALTLFSEGNDLWNGGRYAAAVKAYQAALEQDPDFAMAHAALGRAFMSNIYNDPIRGREHYERALRLAGRITERERLGLLASYQHDLGHRDEAVQDYRVYLGRYPDDVQVRFDLASLLLQNARYQEAVGELEEVVRVHPTDARAWVGLATSWAALGEPSRALAHYAKAFDLEPAWVTLSHLNHDYGFALVSAGDIPRAREVFALAAEKPEMQARALRSLALVDMYEGRYRAAADKLRQAILHNVAAREPHSEARNHLFLALVAEGQGDRGTRLRELDRALDALSRLPEPQVWLAARIAAAQARAGAVAKAARIARGLDARADDDNPTVRGDLHGVEGELALARGDYGRAVDALRLAAEGVHLPLWLPSLADAYRKAGDTQRAAACYEQLTSTDRALGWEPQQAWVAAHVELAETYLARGDRAGAGQKLDRVLRHWKDADAGLPLARRMAAVQARIRGPARAAGAR
jgi:tetratricopeptide (TPR) repeat protein